MAQDYGPDDDRGGASTFPGEGKGRLLHIAEFDSTPPALILRSLREYWEGLRRGEAVPARSDVEPRGIRGVLDHAFILERIAPGAARFRLAGRHLIDMMGMEVRGMPICSLLQTSSRGRFSDVLESVFRGPQIAQLRLSSAPSYARPPMQGHLLLLPLRSDLGDVSRALGCFVAEGSVGQAPRRFDLEEERLGPATPGARVVEPSASAAGANLPEISTYWREAAPRRAGDAGETVAQPPKDATPEQRRALFRIISDRSRRTGPEG